jgi:hypothetical protein
MHPFLARLLILLVGMMLGMVTIVMQNIQVNAASGGGDVAECVEWGKAGKWTLTKCEDDDGVVCITSDSGMFQCRMD